ncbi:PREDICTED: tubulin polyglutamylase complex subunit 1 [Haliaeetus leucocephalus]|uniref:tubulin polyglutamylase complex subunit 1 n=1 Tax=Haliaeetus leucocephalus TaxID=52644 RepID=UPI00053CEDBE|nr:PREDICTED: tubulin polyglutamylase complex subunit 1 [Haliaeetus leucocephalus]
MAARRLAQWAARSPAFPPADWLPVCKMAARALPQPAFAARSQDGGAEFLLRAGVTAMVREALLKVLEARPEEPVSFLADYFERLVLGSPGAAGEAAAELPGPPQRLARALWYVRLAHHRDRTAFDSNAGAAYEVLGAGGRRRKAGVDGRLYSELLRRICQHGGAPAEAAAALLGRVRCRDHEAVPFDVFRYGVLTCFVLLEFAAKADALFGVLDGGSGAADGRVCQAVLRALEDALGTGNFSLPSRYLEAGSKLGPDGLALAMDRALQERKLGTSMSRDEFLKKATALFIARVKPIE